MFKKNAAPKAADNNDQEIREKLVTVFSAVKEKGYDPIAQLKGYLLTEDPTYITTYKNARMIISEIDRDDIFRCILENYFNR